MPDLKGGEWKWAKDELKPHEKRHEVKAENRPGHRPVSSYTLPHWVYHPDLPNRRVFVDNRDYYGMAADGLRNADNWNVAHVAAFHDDMKLLSLATPEQCREPNRWGDTPAHMCGMGQHPYGPSLHVLYELVQMGVVNIDELNHQDHTPWHVCQRMQKPKHVKNFEKVLLKGWKPDNHEEVKASQLMLRGKFRGTPLNAPLPVCLLFPGQGSQYVGMMKDLMDMEPVQKMLQTAKGILGYDILEICLQGPEEKLQQTKYCQPAMYIAGLAAAEALKDQSPDDFARCTAVAGLSLGEYTALTCAGAMSFEDGLRLVKLRGEAMEYEVEKPGASKQAMLSVAGLEQSVVESLCAESRGEGQICQIANFLFPKGFSCAGHLEAVEKLEVKVNEAGALQAKLLKTGGAFHTPLMAPAAAKLRQALQETLPRMKSPRCSVYMNVTAAPIGPSTKPEQIIDMLTEQLTNPVKWDESMLAAISDGCTQFYELGPNKQLKAMMKRINQKMAEKTVNFLA